MLTKPHRPAYPKDLRDAGPVDDPAFERPIVYGRIDTGEVTVRWPGLERVRKEDEAVSEIRVVNVATDGGADMVQRVAELYNTGATWKEMQESTGLSLYALRKHWRNAVAQGIIRETRPAKGGGLHARVAALEKAVEELRSQSPQGPAPGIRTVEEFAGELDQCKRQLDILSSGLAELTRRIEALEVGRLAAAPIDMTRELLRLLEVAITGRGAA